MVKKIVTVHVKNYTIHIIDSKIDLIFIFLENLVYIFTPKEPSELPEIWKKVREALVPSENGLKKYKIVGIFKITQEKDIKPSQDKQKNLDDPLK